MNQLVKNKKFKPGTDWVWYAPNTTDAFSQNEIRAVTNSLRAGWLTAGKITQEFESKIAGLFGKKFGLFVNSGSSANLLAFEILKLPKGTEVITPACNFNTTVAPIVQTGLTPVFVDIKPGEYTLDVSQLENALSKKTGAIIAPHLIGNFVDMAAIRSFCKKHKLVFIEDSCDTIGGSYRGKPSGKWSDITTTSFYASHIITTGGVGGMIMMNSEELREKARVFRDWGRGITLHDENIKSRMSKWTVDGEPYDSAFVFMERGYNFKPTEMQAAFGLEQLKRLNSFTSHRRHTYKRLVEFFKNFEEFFILPREVPDTQTNWLAFPLTVRPTAPFTRNKLTQYLEEHKIQTRPLFSGNILKQPAYKNIKHRKVGNLVNSEIVLKQSFLIGVHHGLTDKMIDYVEEIFEKFLARNT